jgi:hypothetical protein
VSYIAEINLGGNIPGFVMKPVNKEQGYQLVKLRKTVEQFVKDAPY